MAPVEGSAKAAQDLFAQRRRWLARRQPALTLSDLSTLAHLSDPGEDYEITLRCEFGASAKSARRARRRLKGTLQIFRTPAADDLSGTVLIGLARDDAIGAWSAMTVGAAAIAARILRELTAGFLADVFQLVGAVLVQRHFIAKTWVADRDSPK